MGQGTGGLPETDRGVLEDFVVDNRDLDHLEALLAQFNIFEALGVVRQELRHSDFLAFLLGPRQNHGLGDTFLRRLLQRALRAAPSGQHTVSPIDLDGWNLAEAQVDREWHNVDILVRDERHQLVVIIENKIDSAEHSGQLERYLDTVRHHHPGWRIVSLFLTSEGMEPTLGSYAAVSYSTVGGLVDELVESRGSALGDDVRAVLRHYSQLLRRHIVSDSETAELCRRIYRKHQRALDLIFEHRPDQQAAIRDVLVERIERTDGLLLDRAGKTRIEFAPAAWELPALRRGEGWTPSGRMLLFQFSNEPKRLGLVLWLGPGPVEIRQRLYDRGQLPPFRSTGRRIGAKWNSLWSRTFLQPAAYESEDMAGLNTEIDKEWTQFVDHDLPSLVAAITAEEWVRGADHTSRIRSSIGGLSPTNAVEPVGP